MGGSFNSTSGSAIDSASSSATGSPEFVHLHVHSHFSFSSGVADPAEIAAAAAALGMGAVALTDHQGLSGAVRFYRACTEVGIKPIIGCEVVVEPAGILGLESDLPPESRLAPGPPIGQARARAAGFHLTLLAKDFGGYRALCEILSRAHLTGGSRVTLGDLRAHAGSLIGLSGCARSEVALATAAGRYGRAQNALANLAACFAPGDFYVELTNPLTRGSHRLVGALAEAAEILHLPTVATNNVHYLRPSDRRLRDVVSAAGALASLPGPDPDPNAERYLKSAAQMRALFAAHPAAADASLEIAARCNVRFPQGEYHFPGADLRPGESADTVLAAHARAGLTRRYGAHAPGSPTRTAAEQRMDHELATIAEMGFSDYFLIVKDIVDAARAAKIRCTGRGSAGNSIVSYALGISDADPVAYDLLFERFLNRARRKMPDIDIDFDSARRDEVIDYIYRRFGHDHVAMVATVQTTSARGALRIAGRAFGYPATELSSLTRGIPWVGAGRLREALATYPECRGHQLTEPAHRQVVDIASELGHLATHLGTHLGGFIITREPVGTWTPLQYAAKGTVVSQHDKDDVEFLGLVKMDILGLRTHSAISEAVELVAAAAVSAGAAGAGQHLTPASAIARGIDPFDLPHDDPEVYAMIGRGETVGVFQLESSGQRSLSRRLKPTRFDDIVAQISLFRPGPLKADMITPFIRRRHGLEPVTVVHPAMSTVLADTYGIIVYQEQVLRLGREIAGMSLDEADLLRRAMTSRTSPEDLAELERLFVDGAVANNVARPVAVEVFRQLRGFAAYGFNKAHAANFAVISYATAHLRRYHPAELACAILNNEPMGFYSPRAVLNDARRSGVPIRPLNVNASEWRCTIERGSEGVAAIRIGFSYCHSMTHRTYAAIAAARAHRPFTGADDLVARAGVAPRTAEVLARLGALDTARQPAPDTARGAAGQHAFGERLRRPSSGADAVDSSAPAECSPNASGPAAAAIPAAAPRADRIAAELSWLGLSVSAHPLELCRADLAARGVTLAADLASLPDRTRVRVVGLRERAQTPPTRSGKRTCFLTLEDATGFIDVVVFSDALEAHAKTLAHGKCFLVEGTVQNTPAHGLAVIADRVEHYSIRDERGGRLALGRSTRTDAPGPTPGRLAPDMGF